jgi:hypothetical protein
MRLRAYLVALAALGFAGAAKAATEVADYQFNGDLSSSIAGAPDLIAVDPTGAASFGPSGGYSWGGAASPVTDQGGLEFNSTGLLNPDSYSVQLTFDFTDRNGEWRRILDVQNRASDAGFYVDPSNNLDIFPVAGSTGAFTTGKSETVLLTVGGDVVTGYLNGVKQFTATTAEMNLDDTMNNPNHLIGLFLDNTAGGGQGEWSAGTITSAEFFNGVVGTVPEPATWAMMLLGVGGMGTLLRSKRRAAITTAMTAG